MKTAYIINARQFNTVQEYATAVGLTDFQGEWMDLARFLEVPINPKGGRRSISEAYKSLIDAMPKPDSVPATEKSKKAVSTKVAVVQTAATVQIPVQPVVEAVDAVAVGRSSPAAAPVKTPKAPKRVDFQTEEEFDEAFTAWMQAKNAAKAAQTATPVALPVTAPAHAAVIIEQPEVAEVIADTVDTLPVPVIPAPAAQHAADIASAVEADNVEETAKQLAKLLANLNTKGKAQPLDLNQIAQTIQDEVADQTKDLLDYIKNVDMQLSTAFVELEKLIGSGVKSIQVKVNNAPAVKIAGQVHERFEDILLHVSVRDNVMLVGPAGSGKTTVCENVAEALGLDFYCKSVCSQTSKSELLGYMDANGNFVSTEFRVAYENGGVFVLDEIDAGNPNVIAVLNSALANSYCAFADGMIRKHEDFVLIACANTFGTGANREYVGRNQLDSATLDRFSVIEFGYDEALELALGADETFTKFVQAARKELAGERVVISPRASIQGGKLLAAGAKPEHVLQTRIIKGMATNLAERVKAVFKRFYAI